MPVYNFQARFAGLVREGIKRQTICARRRDEQVPKVGDRFVAYAGMRTKKCRRLMEGRIVAVMPIEISAAGIRLEGKDLDAAQANALALLDGFASANEMIGWFIETHGRGRFVGHLIRWI